MTREQKLALIVGFSLILLVGVLISDHLSRAREARVAAVRPDEIGVVNEPLPVRPDPMRLIPQQQLASANQPAASPDLVPPQAGGVIPLGDRAAAETTPETQVPTVAMFGVPGRADSGPIASEPIEVIAQGRWLNDPPADTAASSEDQPLIDHVIALGGKVANGEIHLPAAAGTSRPGMGAPVPPPVVSVTPAATQPLPIAPIRWHTVEKGDSLFTIAKRYYGDGKVWPKLAKHNAGRVGDNGSIRYGVRLQIPPAETLGVRAAAQPAPAAASSPQRPKEPARPAKPDSKEAKPTGRPTYATYTVRRGDTLGEIAQRILGTTRRKGELIELNRDRIKDEDSIRIGMVLKVPTDN